MSGLQRLVYLRGGLHSLGWGGILHTFISWYRILSPWANIDIRPGSAEKEGLISDVGKTSYLLQ